MKILDQHFKHNENIVTRKIENEFILVPIKKDIGDDSDYIFALNSTARETWKLLDGKKSLSSIIEVISRKYKKNEKIVKKDILELMKDLSQLKLIKPTSK